MSKLGWFITLVAVACVAGVGIAGYVFYKYRLRVSPLVFYKFNKKYKMYR